MTTKNEILAEVLTQSFELNRYMKLIREFFNSLEATKHAAEKTQIPKQFTYTIESYHHLAFYTDNQSNRIAILAVKLKSGRSVERSRSVQRNFVSKIISDAGCDAAIVAFYTDNDPKWRLSFVRLDQTWDAGKFKTTITPAKRYSYLVGEQEPCRTAQERLLPIFENEDFNPTLDKIEEAFSVEIVTNEFFKEYRNTYFVLKDYLDCNEQFIKISQKNQFTSEQFAKKLMGQLAFLYFLQKKGWLGVKGVPQILNDKDYRNAYFKKHHPRVKEIIETIYKKTEQEEYRLNTGLLTSSKFSNEDAQILAKCFTNHKWGTGEKMFIRHLFEHCKKQKGKNFFKDFLQPLFYEALCIDRGGYQYYKRFNCKIPFLNGGLFDPIENYDWANTSFDIPDELFSNRDEKGDYYADGILDMFERYNFTMNEDEPLEREVAVDPEMLGKIFENLLDDTDRKSKGAFYTPREIVHYMCQESLIQHLIKETAIPYDDMKNFVLYGEIMKDEDMYKANPNQTCLPKTVFEKLSAIETALKNICIADPAVGSGAFPLGMLSEIIKIRTNIVAYNANQIPATQKELRAQYYETNNPYNLKLETIKNCIHAVDIEPSAVDIAKLRFWLSLVVDEDLEPTFLEQRYANATQRDPHPLPNLDYNIMCGDSLVDEFEGIKLFDDNIFLDTDKKDVQQQLFKNTTHSLLDDLFKLQEKFYNESDLNKKMKLKETIDNDIDKIIRTKLEQDGDDAALQKYEKSLKTKVKPYFLWKLEFGKVFKEKGGFDIVLGNPPYLKEGRVLKEVFDGIRETIYYQGKMDLWYAFAWKGIDLLTDTGHLCFIATNNWTTNTGASKLRNKVIVDTRIVQLIDFGNVMIFESASIQTMVMLFQKNKRADNYSFDYRKLQGDTTLSDAVSLLQKRQNAKAEYLSPNIVRENLMDSFLVFSKSESLFEKIAFEKEFLKEKEVANGIHPHYDFVNNKIAARHNFMVGEGIFGLTEQEKQNLHLSEKELELIKPYYTTEQIHRYYSDSANTLWLIYTNSSFKNPRSMDNNPILKRHLDRFADVITSDNKPYGLHRAREERFFNGEKLIALRKCVGRPSFSYSDFDCYVSATFYVIKTARFSMKYLLGLFNSRLMMFWLKNKGKMQGVNFQLDKEPLLGMPIQPISKNHEELFIVLVDQILVAKQNDPHADTSDLESQIDAIVFNLYGLTEEEIMTVLLSMPSVSESERRNIQAYYKELIANSKKPKV